MWHIKEPTHMNQQETKLDTMYNSIPWTLKIYLAAFIFWEELKSILLTFVYCDDERCATLVFCFKYCSPTLILSREFEMCNSVKTQYFLNMLHFSPIIYLSGDRTLTVQKLRIKYNPSSLKMNWIMVVAQQYRY